MNSRELLKRFITRAQKHERRLTHHLDHDPKTGRWSCKCGYVLGTGHDALYAQCAVFRHGRHEEREQAYAENSLSLERNATTKGAAPRKQAARKGKRAVSKRVADLFDL